MRYSILLLLFVQLIFLVNYSLGSSDGCGTISSITTNTVPISGKIKIFVIFAQFKDDDSASVEWPVNHFLIGRMTLLARMVRDHLHIIICHNILIQCRMVFFKLKVTYIIV